jgi:hypothetical protein
VSLEVACQPAMVTDPADRALDDPALRQHREPMLVAAADDLQLPAPGPLHGGGHLRSLVSGVTDDALDEREQPTRLPQQRLGPVAVLHRGRVDHHAEQQPKRVGQDMALASDGLLARIKAGWIERRPPFCAVFAVWLSMIAVVGLGSRPARSRSAT